MKRNQILIGILFILLTFGISADTTAPKKSSEIPARREFPVNPAINPCEDFYGYTCSKVIDSFELREDRKAHTFAFHDSAERILDFKKKYFKELGTKKPANKREAALQEFYLSCMDPSVGSQDEKARIDDEKAQLANVKDRKKLLHFFQSKIIGGDFSPIGFGTTLNFDEPDKLDLVFSVKGLMTLPEPIYYQNLEMVKDLESNLTAFFRILKAENPEKRALSVLGLEKKIALVFPERSKIRDLFSTRTSISRTELLNNYPNFQLETVLERVPENTVIRNITPEAFKQWNTLLEEESLDSLKDFYLYHSLGPLLDDAYPEYFQLRFNFAKKHFGGPNIRPVREERCTSEIMRSFTMELDSILFDRYFPNFPTEKVKQTAEKIRSSIVSTLERNSWLSENARASAIKKIKTATLQLVKPNDDEEWNFNLTGEYSRLHPLKNRTLANELSNEKDLRELRIKINSRRWSMGPLTVNAYYSPSWNKFVLPAGVLQYPFFDEKGDDFTNLASIGSTIGHELGHAIDDKGSKFDFQGKLNAWMKDSDLEEFKKRGKKLGEFFAAAGMNPDLTQGENIGDLVGVTAALKAAFPDGTPKNPESLQKFFLNYGRLWCQIIRPAYAELLKKTDPHSMHPARVNEQVKQQADFKTAFSCKDTDKMILPQEKRVVIW